MTSPPSHNRHPLRFGLCADVHKDIMHDADERLRTFIDRMVRKQVDFIVQLGDFCRPYDDNRPFLGIWDSFPGERLHVMGNHDPDGGFTRDQVTAYWDMPGRYCSQDVAGYHLVMLDGNDEREGRSPGYPRYIGDQQLDWLRDDLADATGPTLVFSHQSLEAGDGLHEGVENKDQVRAVLEEANQRATGARVVACFSGHNHIDACNTIAGIHYLQINSMSNYWMGDDYQHVRYGADVDADFPWIKYTAPYRDPLYALGTVDPSGILSIEGVESEFVGPSPWDLEFPHPHMADRIVPAISPRALVLEMS